MVNLFTYTCHVLIVCDTGPTRQSPVADDVVLVVVNLSTYTCHVLLVCDTGPT